MKICFCVHFVPQADAQTQADALGIEAPERYVVVTEIRLPAFRSCHLLPSSCNCSQNRTQAGSIKWTAFTFTSGTCQPARMHATDETQTSISQHRIESKGPVFCNLLITGASRLYFEGNSRTLHQQRINGRLPTPGTLGTVTGYIRNNVNMNIYRYGCETGTVWSKVRYRLNTVHACVHKHAYISMHA